MHFHERYTGRDFLTQQRARALYYFLIAFALSLVFGILIYVFLIPQRMIVAVPPMSLGLLSIALSLLLLMRGRAEYAANFFNFTLALILIVAQFNKLRGDNQTAYTSFIYVYLLPVLTAGLFNRKRMVLIMGAVMTCADAGYFVLVSRQLTESDLLAVRTGFVSSIIILAAGTTLIYFTRDILEAALRRLEALNESLDRFVPHEFLRYLSKSSVLELNSGDRTITNVAVMFCDIRNFTSMTEKIGNSETFSLLQQYFGAMAPVIRANNGFVDKYVGDAMMALFASADEAVNAALEMLNTLRSVNTTNTTSLEIGIGIEQGSVVMGAIGEARRIDNTVIGDSVNTSARLQGLARKLRVSLVISESVYNAISVREKFVRRGKVSVKGKSVLLTIFTPVAEV